MALRALLFSSDSSATALLCEILTDLHMEAEICPEMLVASERIARENYDALFVDWDQEYEAAQLLKSAREKKGGSALNLALVQSDREVGPALQNGANSVIKKPIDRSQAEDTLSTARDLILSRRAEQKYKEERIAATAAGPANQYGTTENDAPSPKTGFLQQTAPRSAFDVATQGEKPEAINPQPSGWQAARGPEELRADREQVQEVRLPEKKRWDDKPAPKIPVLKVEEPPHEDPAHEETTAVQSPTQDSTGVFSSLPEEQSEPQEVPRPKPHYQRLGFVLVGCLLIVGVLYVWAPGDSYSGRLSPLWHLLPQEGHATKTSTTPPPAAAQPAPPAHATKDDDTAADSAPLVTTDVDPNKIQIIETKPVPKTGAQVPPSDTPPPGSDQARAQALPQAQADGAADNPPAAPDSSVPMATPPPNEAPADVPVSVSTKPAIVPVAQQRPTVPLASANNPPTLENRNGTVIPDSLRNSPWPAPASSLEPAQISEETARGLLVHSVDPEYPSLALQKHVEGAVVLQVSVAKDGSVQDVKLMKGYLQLSRAAVDAVRQWRFKAYVVGGKPTNFQTPITINFKYPQ
jgi:protein TonB